MAELVIALGDPPRMTTYRRRTWGRRELCHVGSRTCMCTEVEHGVSVPSHKQWASWTNGVDMLWASDVDSGTMLVVDVVLRTKPISSRV